MRSARIDYVTILFSYKQRVAEWLDLVTRFFHRVIKVMLVKCVLMYVKLLISKC